MNGSRALAVMSVRNGSAESRLAGSCRFPSRNTAVRPSCCCHHPHVSPRCLGYCYFHVRARPSLDSLLYAPSSRNILNEKAKTTFWQFMYSWGESERASCLTFSFCLDGPHHEAVQEESFRSSTSARQFGSHQFGDGRAGLHSAPQSTLVQQRLLQRRLRRLPDCHRRTCTGRR